jgi:hypothetical protein
MKHKRLRCERCKEGELYAIVTYRGEIHLFDDYPTNIEELKRLYTDLENIPVGLEMDYTPKSLKEVRLVCNSCDYEQVVVKGPLKIKEKE